MSEETNPKPNEGTQVRESPVIPQSPPSREDLGYERTTFEKSEKPVGGLTEGYSPIVDVASPPPGQGDGE
jgi:hypothetical protein